MKNKDIEELLNKLKQHLEYQKEVSDVDSNVAYLRLTIKEYKLLLSYIEQLEKENKELKDIADEPIQIPSFLFDMTQELKIDELEKELQTTANKCKQLQNNRDKAIEVVNTQLKNAEGGLKDNLRIIKFNLIKGSCTFEDLKTEEDYKYILKGDSDD